MPSQRQRETFAAHEHRCLDGRERDRLEAKARSRRFDDPSGAPRFPPDRTELSCWDGALIVRTVAILAPQVGPRTTNCACDSSVRRSGQCHLPQCSRSLALPLLLRPLRPRARVRRTRAAAPAEPAARLVTARSRRGAAEGLPWRAFRAVPASLARRQWAPARRAGVARAWLRAARPRAAVERRGTAG